MPVKVVGQSHLMTELLISTFAKGGYDVDETSQSVSDLAQVQDGDIIVLHALENCENVPSSVDYLRSIEAGISILVLCSESSIVSMREQLGRDVNAILSDTTDITSVLGSLAVVSAGLNIMHPSQLDASSHSESELLSTNHENNSLATRATQLSIKERHVLSGIERGLSNKAIGNKMGIKETTVKVHLRSIYQKLGVKNRTQAALWSRINQ
jgi:DNA-binding NarL/FixJ family response regulator